MNLDVSGTVIEWRGPSPFHFLPIVGDDADAIASVAADVTYGWGMVPVAATIGSTWFRTSLWPKDGGYLLPLKDAVRRSESIQPGVTIVAVIELDPG